MSVGIVSRTHQAIINIRIRWQLKVISSEQGDKREWELSEMSQAQITSALSIQGRPLVFAAKKAIRIPWTIWFIASGAILNLLSVFWDDTWHSSIGTDTSWIPPHILMQISAVVALSACAYALLTATFNSASPARDASVRLMGLYAPAGVFIAAWGCLATLLGGQTDAWWHEAYGDVTIVTPPHLLLLIGSVVTKIGGMAWIASTKNGSAVELRDRLKWLFLIVGTSGMKDALSFLLGTRSMHTADYYQMFALAVPIWLIACAWGSAHKWGGTIIAGFYMAVSLGAEWLLPLIPAQPKFGPVYHNVIHLIPPSFPVLLIVPAFVADILLQRLAQRPFWIRALWLGPSLVLSSLVVQWPFADFLLSPAARNRIFGTGSFGYRDPAGLLYDPYKFRPTEKLGTFLLTLVIAFAISVLTTRLGVSWGDWMRRVRR
jgi:hypothetical protein